MYGDDDDDFYELDWGGETKARKSDLVRNILLAVIALLLAMSAAGVCLAYGHLSGVSGFTRQVRNPANLVDASRYGFRDGQVIGGIEFHIDGDGVITLDGQVVEDFSVGLGSYTLSSADYNFSTVADNPLNYKSAIELSGLEGTVSKSILFRENYTYRPTKANTVTVCLVFRAGDAFQQYRIAPVIVPGNRIGEYFITQSVTL